MDKTLKVGIQGNIGSSNYRAALHFAKKYQWQNPEFVALLTTHRVLEALASKEIDYGTFAWESSRVGLVAETQAAIKTFSYHKLDEIDLEMNHAIFTRPGDLPGPGPQVFSHPQALAEHAAYLRERFPAYQPQPEIDTALAAERLAKGEYPVGSLAIAPLGCLTLFHLELVASELPSNQGYWTKIFLAERAS